jgi:hypothetical protein
MPVTFPPRQTTGFCREEGTLSLGALHLDMWSLSESSRRITGTMPDAGHFRSGSIGVRN